LKEFGAEFGFAVHLHAALTVHGLEVSSSAVRGLVAAGDVRRARWMLGAAVRREIDAGEGARGGNEAAGAYGEPGGV